MTLLEKIKYEVEEELGNPTEDIEGADLWVDEIAKRYAKAILERAADNAKIKLHDGHFKKDSLVKHVQMGANNATIDKQSILNTDLE